MVQDWCLEEVQHKSLADELGLHVDDVVGGKMRQLSKDCVLAKAAIQAQQQGNWEGFNHEHSPTWCLQYTFSGSSVR